MTATNAVAQRTLVIADSTGGFTVTYLGYSYDLAAGTSTWRYGVQWNSGPALSHWTLQLCKSLTSADIAGYTPPGAGSLSLDPTTGIYGFKWDMGQNVTYQEY